jgi:hypothetical protein
LAIDLADSLAGHAVDLADLVQGAGSAVGQPEPQSDHSGLPLVQGGKDRLQLDLQPTECRRVQGVHGLGVFDEVAELAVALVADGLVEADRLPRVVLDLRNQSDPRLTCGVSVLVAGV